MVPSRVLSRRFFSPRPCRSVLSEKLVENTIREIKPQVVMVELDAQRVGSFLEESMKVVLISLSGRLSRSFFPPFGC